VSTAVLDGKENHVSPVLSGRCDILVTSRLLARRIATSVGDCTPSYTSSYVLYHRCRYNAHLKGILAAMKGPYLQLQELTSTAVRQRILVNTGRYIPGIACRRLSTARNTSVQHVCWGVHCNASYCASQRNVICAHSVTTAYLGTAGLPPGRVRGLLPGRQRAGLRGSV
jgi:hypothetical protein